MKLYPGKLRRNFQTIVSLAAIQWNYRSDFRFYSKTVKLGDVIFLSDPIVWDEGNHFSQMTITFMAKAFHRMRSVKLLCRQGQAKDAALILRSMFEDLVDFKYMHEHKNEIIDFIEYDSYIRLKMGETLLRSGPPTIDRDRVEKRNDELRRQWNRVKHKFSYKDKKGKTRIHDRWTKASLRGTAQKVGLDSVYDFLYGYISTSFEHSASIVGDNYILGRNGDNMTVSVGATEEFVREVLTSARGIFLDMLGIVNEEYKLGFDEKLNRLGIKPTPEIPLEN